MHKDDWKVRRDTKYHNVEVVANGIAKLESLKKEAAKRKQTFDRRMFDAGTEWYNNGLTLADATEEQNNSVSFVNGYRHAERLAFIRELDSKSGKTR